MTLVTWLPTEPTARLQRDIDALIKCMEDERNQLKAQLIDALHNKEKQWITNRDLMAELELAQRKSRNANQRYEEKSRNYDVLLAHRDQVLAELNSTIIAMNAREETFKVDLAVARNSNADELVRLRVEMADLRSENEAWARMKGCDQTEMLRQCDEMQTTCLKSQKLVEEVVAQRDKYKGLLESITGQHIRMEQAEGIQDTLKEMCELSKIIREIR